MRQLLILTTVLMSASLPALLVAQPTRGRDVAITIARHDIHGSPIRYRHGVLTDVLVTGHVRPAKTWSAIAASGVGVILGRMPECAIQSDGRCAPSGSFIALNSLVGVEKTLGRAAGRLFVGPALHHGNDATSVGWQGRIAISIPVDDELRLGTMVRVTRLPSHHGESLTLWAYGGSVTF